MTASPLKYHENEIFPKPYFHENEIFETKISHVFTIFTILSPISRSSL